MTDRRHRDRNGLRVVLLASVVGAALMQPVAGLAAAPVHFGAAPMHLGGAPAVAPLAPLHMAAPVPLTAAPSLAAPPRLGMPVSPSIGSSTLPHVGSAMPPIGGTMPHFGSAVPRIGEAAPPIGLTAPLSPMLRTLPGSATANHVGAPSSRLPGAPDMPAGFGARAPADSFAGRAGRAQAGPDMTGSGHEPAGLASGPGTTGRHDHRRRNEFARRQAPVTLDCLNPLQLTRREFDLCTNSPAPLPDNGQ
jgi:hypothetical protein